MTNKTTDLCVIEYLLSLPVEVQARVEVLTKPLNTEVLQLSIVALGASKGGKPGEESEENTPGGDLSHD